MGVDYALFERLCDLAQRFRPEGRTLMLGRHSFRVNNRFYRLYDRALRPVGLDATPRDLEQEDGYCERLMARLGFGDMESMDFSDYEGAGILHDLNRPVPEELEGQFGMIFDGGTIEHVFNVPMALENVFRMLRPGGRFVSANGMNGWIVHGMYQFNPELVWTYWGRGCGCKVHDCRGIPTVPRAETRHFPFEDPALTGRRIRLKRKGFPAGRVYLYYEIERLPESRPTGTVLQSDYVTRWAPHKTAAETRSRRTEDA